MNWETVTQVLRTAGLAVVSTLASKLVSETESQLTKTEQDTAKTDKTSMTYIEDYVKQQQKKLGLR